MPFCPACDLDKDVEEFRPRSAPNQHLRYKTCRKCETKVNKEWWAQDRRKRRKVLWNYGMTPDDYDDLMSKQGGTCKICHGHPDKGNYFHVDHDHRCCSTLPTCGKCTRGLLCSRCNKGLGMFWDDPDILVAAAHYVLSGGE